MKRKVLAQGDVERVRQRYGGVGTEIVDDFPPKEGEYDMIVLDHLLQQAKRTQAPKIIEMYKKALKIGGELVVITPCLEWIAQQILTEDNLPLIVYLNLYGMDHEPHLSGFTLYWLRLLMESAGLHVKSAFAEWYVARMNDAEYRVMQNVVIGTRIDEDPAEAIP